MALLLGLAAACSKQPAAPGTPPPATDPKAAATVPARPTAATAPNANEAPVVIGAPGSSPTMNPGSAVFNQYDPPMRVPISR
jgi:hypothetical protein